MILDVLSEETIQLLYIRLQEARVFPMLPFSRNNVKQMFINYCETRKLPLSSQVIYNLLYKDKYVVRQEESMPIDQIIEGVYQQEFRATNDQVFGISKLEDCLKKYRGKKITILILAD